mgnify:CR=1 FL=1
MSGNARSALLLAVQGAGRTSAKNPEAVDQGLSRRIRSLRPAELHRDESQPRRVFDEQAIARLSETVRAFGILAPIVVSPREEGEGYTIVLGERRFRAAVAAGLAEVPTITVGALAPRERLELQLLENVSREDLNVVEEARGYARLVELGCSQREIALRVGRSEASVSRALAISKLSAEWLDEVEKHPALASPSKLYEIAQTDEGSRAALWNQLKAGATRADMATGSGSSRERTKIDPALLTKLDSVIKKLRATHRREIDGRRINRHALIEHALGKLLETWGDQGAQVFVSSLES